MIIVVQTKDKETPIRIIDDDPANQRWAMVVRLVTTSKRGKPLVVWCLSTDSDWGDRFSQRRMAIEEAGAYVRTGVKGSWNAPPG